MEKISGIIPQTPRTASKRITDNTPVRPGTPQFGRPVGSSEIKDRVSLSSVRAPELKTYKNTKEAEHVKIADALTRKFFMTPQAKVQEDESDLTTDTVAPEANTPELAVVDEI